MTRHNLRSHTLSIVLCLIFVAVLSFLTEPSPAQAQGQATAKVWVKRAPYKAKQSLSIEHKIDFRFKAALYVNNKAIRKYGDKRQYQSLRSVQIQAMKQKKVQSFTVRYKTYSLKTFDPSGQEIKDDLLKGKSYTVGIKSPKGKDPVFTVLDAKGQKANAEEAELVEREEQDLVGLRSTMYARAIPDRALKFGESVKVTSRLATTLLDPTGEFEMDSMTLKLTGTKTLGKASCAVFELFAKGHGESPIAKNTLELRGELIVEIATGQLRRLVMEGPVRVLNDNAAQGSTMHLRGSGRFKRILKID